MAITRRTIRFRSGPDDCAASVFEPTGATRPGPAVVLGHGLGAVKVMGLETYAVAFAEAGYVAVAFDYRHFGMSGGQPRQLLDVGRQRADWVAAVEFTRSLESVDPERVALFGSSFGGGHAIVTAANDRRVKAVIAQCPFTSGVASALTIDRRTLPVVIGRALLDQAAHLVGAQVRVPLAARPGKAALMNAPDAEPGYLALLPEGETFTNGVAARVALRVPLDHPGRRAKDVGCPILFQVCDHDSVAPAGPTLRYAAQAPKGEVKRYATGHFDIYRYPWLEQAIADQVEFLNRHLPPSPPS